MAPGQGGFCKAKGKVPEKKGSDQENEYIVGGGTTADAKRTCDMKFSFVLNPLLAPISLRKRAKSEKDCQSLWDLVSSLTSCQGCLWVTLGHLKDVFGFSVIFMVSRVNLALAGFSVIFFIETAACILDIILHFISVCCGLRFGCVNIFIPKTCKCPRILL